jgi:hypothetical protein
VFIGRFVLAAAPFGTFDEHTVSELDVQPLGWKPVSCRGQFNGCVRHIDEPPPVSESGVQPVRPRRGGEEGGVNPFWKVGRHKQSPNTTSHGLSRLATLQSNTSSLHAPVSCSFHAPVSCSRSRFSVSWRFPAQDCHLGSKFSFEKTPHSLQHVQHLA